MGAGSFFKTVGKVAFPFISTAAQAGGPFTSMAANAVGKLLGIAPTASTDEIETAMASAVMNPDQMIALKKIEEEFQAQMAQLDITLEQIAAGDRASARAMQMTTKSRIVPALAMLVVSAYLLLLSLLMAGQFHASDSQALLLLLGGLNTAFAAVIMYFFGSSAGSDRKTELLAQAPSIPK